MSQSNEEHELQQQPWPTEPGSAAPHYLDIPPPPSMYDIQEAFTEEVVPEIAVVESERFLENTSGAECAAVLTATPTTSHSSHHNNNCGVVRAQVEQQPGGQQIGVVTAVADNIMSGSEWRGDPSIAVWSEPSQAALHSPQLGAAPSAAAATTPANLLPSPHVPFMGYMDEQGVVHTQSGNDSSSISQGNANINFLGGLLPENSNDTLERCTAKQSLAQNLSSRMSSLSTANGEEEKSELPAKSVESILQDSLTFERSNPEKRFSSSGSSRHLYPSLEDDDFGRSGSGRISAREESSSVRTTVSGIIRSAASTETVMEASSSLGASSSIVPEPPGMEPIAAVSFPNHSNENGTSHMNSAAAVAVCEDMKVGAAGMEPPASASPTYAVASLEGAQVNSAEATVLETTQTPEEELMRKLEAEDAELIALKRSAYVCGSAVSSMPLSANHQQATVVEITEHDVHPSDISNDSVRAELIGEDYNITGSVPATAASTASRNNGNYYPLYENTVAGGHAATGAVFAGEDPGYAVVGQEATIIDQEATSSSWYPAHAEEAMVLNEEDSSSIPYSERKLPAVNSRAMDDHQGAAAAVIAVAEADIHTEATVGLPDNSYPQLPGHQTVAFAAEEAEVVDIAEEFHPAEVTGTETQAELVGQLADDFSGVAVASLEPTTATAAATFEATASLSEEVSGVQAATVVGYEDEDEHNDGMIRAHSLGVPLTDPTTPVVRTNSAPSAIGTRVSLDEPAATAIVHEAVTELETVVEEDWMRTPSFRGVSSDSVMVLQPPRDGEEQPHAVAVASLDAYDSSHAPALDGTDCRSPAQPAVTATALDAFAASPAPAFDPTDCRLVNRETRQPTAPTSTTAVNSSTFEPEFPPPRSFNSTGGASDAASVGSSASSRVGFQKISSSFARGMEMLFGDTKIATPNGKRSDFVEDGANVVAESVIPRELLPWSVIHSEATNMWVATVNTNQKALDSKNVVEASKSLRAFSVVTDKQATCLAKAWSPPRMHAFSKSPACTICKSKFAVFRRACHCRNCGICVCTTCVVNWPAKMVPETYNIKKESFVNICKACDWLCTSFRVSLLEGNRDKAIALHATGNINLVTPFANVKGELFYPVHCAALGGDLELLKWLVDENCCPIKSVRVSGRCRDASNSFTEISTSKGRSLLGIALENSNVGIVRYLVVEKGIQLAGEKDITMDTLCRNLDLVLRFLPEDAVGHAGVNMRPPVMGAPDTSEREEFAPPKQSTRQPSLRAVDDSASDGSVSDACIICFDATIDCVATPCGHQICCIKCSTNITKCPVCAIDCTFMRVFRP